MGAAVEFALPLMLCASALAVAATPGRTTEKAIPAAGELVRQVYYDGKLVEMKFAPGRAKVAGTPWTVPTQTSREKPKDRHPNIYIVVPGTQYVEQGAEEYAHNEIVSVVPVTETAIDWDVYYAIVLDPTLHEDFHSEQRLILATQEDFDSGAEFDFEDIPGSAYLKNYLGIRSLDGLKTYRRSGNRLPRVIIVPAQLTVKASVVDPDVSDTKSEETGSTVRKRRVIPTHSLRH